MKHKLLPLLLLFSLTHCYFNDSENDRIESPTRKLEINTTVNRTDKNSDDYGIVIIHVFHENKELAELNTTAGDANKWNVGWTEFGDTIIFQSSDIGNKAWIMKNENPIEIKMTDKLNERAKNL